MKNNKCQNCLIGIKTTYEEYWDGENETCSWGLELIYDSDTEELKDIDKKFNYCPYCGTLVEHKKNKEEEEIENILSADNTAREKEIKEKIEELMVTLFGVGSYFSEELFDSNNR